MEDTTVSSNKKYRTTNREQAFTNEINWNCWFLNKIFLIQETAAKKIQTLSKRLANANSN